MSCFNKLKRLKGQINHLFCEGFNEDAIFDQIHTDEQFADFSREQVQAFYSHLQEEFSAETWNKRQISECDQQIAECQQEIAKCQQEILKHKQQITEYEQLPVQQHQIGKNQWQISEHEWRIAEHKWKIADYKRLIEEHQQKKTELEFMANHQQNLNKFLIHDGTFANRIDIKCFLQGRFFVTVEDRDATGYFYSIKVQDLFQDTTKSFAFQKTGDFCDIYALKFPYVLLHEFDEFNYSDYFCLAKFDFEGESLQVVHSLEYNDDIQILVNASDVSKFLLKKGNVVNECKLVVNQIQIGKKVDLKSNICFGSYFDNQFCNLRFEDSFDNQFENYQLIRVKMFFHDLERNKHSTQSLNSTPENVHCLDPYNPNYFAWVRDTVFLAFQFRLTEKFGIIFTSPQLRNWKVIEFATDLRINHIQPFVDGNLMLCSEEEEERKRKIYKLRMRKPDFLRNMAWTKIVNLFKEAKVESPYEKARQYLPLNSEIQPFIFSED